jgi:hypothetical protein
MTSKHISLLTFSRPDAEEIIPKSKKLGLSFPYDWSNPNIPDDALIFNVLDRCIFDDICKIVFHFGLHRVVAMWRQNDADDIHDRILVRILNNIQWVLEHEKNISR